MPTVIILEVEELADDLAGRAPSAGLLPLAGHPMVAYAARAFRACGNIDAVVLAGPEAYRDEAAALAEFDDPPLLAATVAERVDLALDGYADRDELLFWPANGPLLSPEAVESFLRHAPVSAGLCWSWVRLARIEAAFDGLGEVPHHRFGGEALAIGGLGSVRPAALEGRRDKVRQMLSQPLVKGDLVKLLGVGFAIKYMAYRATLHDLMAKLGEVAGFDCLAAILPHPELCFRVRNRAEHHLARAWLEAR